jgi:peroxiredoxin
MADRPETVKPRGRGRARERARLLVCAACTSVAALLLATAPRARAEEEAEPRIGERVPAFHLYDTSGALVALRDHVVLPGQRPPLHPKAAVVLDFFRTDCKPCRASLPHLVGLHRKLAARGVLVALVALLEEDEGEARLEAFLKQTPLPFPVLVDAYGVVAKKYVRKGEGFQIPQTFVVDRQAVLRVRQGALDAKAAAALQASIEALLK